MLVEFPIEFDIADLNRILGTLNKGLVIYTSSKDLHFNHFRHADGVQNICRRRDLTDDICSLFFRSHLLPLLVIILYSILQHVVTLRQGHTNEITRLDVGLLNSILQRKPIDIGYTILSHMLLTPLLNNCLLPMVALLLESLRNFMYLFGSLYLM